MTRIMKFWESFFQKKRSRLSRFLNSLLIAIIGFLVLTALHGLTGHHYYSSITIYTAILITLYSGVYLSVLFAATLTLLADYLFTSPVGTVFGSSAAIEYFLIFVSISLTMSLLLSTLRSAFHLTLTAKQEAETAKQEAVLASDAMEHVLAAISHDIRNPLAAAKLSAEVICRSLDMTDKNQKLSEKIIKSLSRADTMIQTLLDVSRIRSNKGISLDFVYCDLVSIVTEATEDLAIQYGNRIRFEKQKPILGIWSSDGILRAVENLVTNAVKYGSNDTLITLTIEKESDMAILSVHNEGNEISKSDQAKLFDAFQRNESVEHGKIIGWGLGLSLVKGITEAHLGTIEVDSIKGSGTTFSLRLPIRGAIELQKRNLNFSDNKSELNNVRSL